MDAADEYKSSPLVSDVLDNVYCIFPSGGIHSLVMMEALAIARMYAQPNQDGGSRRMLSPDALAGRVAGAYRN